MRSKRPRSKRLGRKDMARLEQLLEELNAPVSLAEACGLIAAIASAPTTMMPSEWRHLVLGDPVYETHEQAQEVFDLVLGVWNQTVDDLRRGLAIPDIDDPSWVEHWCVGFLKGSRLDPEWRDDEQGVTLLLPLAILAGELELIGTEDEKGDVITDDTRQKTLARESLQEHVAILYEYWLQWRRREYAPSEAGQTASPKIGRNEKCPCGSGLKYKKCCGKPQ